MRKVIKIDSWIEYDHKKDVFTVHFNDMFDRRGVISTQKITRHSCNGYIGYIHEEVKPKTFKWKWLAKKACDRKYWELANQVIDRYRSNYERKD